MMIKAYDGTLFLVPTIMIMDMIKCKVALSMMSNSD